MGETCCKQPQQEGKRCVAAEYENDLPVMNEKLGVSGARAVRSDGEVVVALPTEYVNDLPVLAPQLEMMNGSWAWIRSSNGPQHRQARLEAGRRLREAFKVGGYAVKCGGTLHEIHFKRLTDMISQTSVLSISANLPALDADPGLKTVYEYHSGSAIERAAELSIHGFKPAVLSAASAYHAGGGFTSGGRHALEEAFCMQSTLYPSLEKILSASQGPSHIPEDGAIVSPGVEIFRRGSDQGYPLHQTTVPIAAVVSVAMFNRNAKVKDAPVDAPTDGPTYERLTKDKLKVAVHGAAFARADAFIIPDVGCGVFENDPKLLGTLAGQVLKDYHGYFLKVVFTGKPEFCDAAATALDCQLARHTAPSVDVPLCTECIVCGHPFLAAASLAVLLCSTGGRASVRGASQPGLRFLHTACADSLSPTHKDCSTMTLPEVATDPESFLRALDVDGNGALSKAEVRCAAAALWSDSSLWGHLLDNEFDRRFEAWDKDGSGELNLSELEDGMPQQFLEWVRQSPQPC